MRALAVSALIILVVLPSGRSAQAAGGKEVDYTGWQIIVTGIEITTTKYHGDLGYTLDDKCTVTKRGSSKYVVVKRPEGQGLERFSAERVAASTHLAVSGQGKAHFYSADPPLTKSWSYQLGPSDYPKDMESFCPISGGKPQSSPDEPMFMPRAIQVSSYVPETEWSVTPERNSSLGQAKDLIIKAYREAIAADYRFYSFGDAMLVL